VEIGSEPVDLPGQLCIRLEFQFLLPEVVISLCLLNAACRFWPIITNVDRKITSSDTINVSVGHGLFLDEQHPDSEDRDVQVDEVHRPGESSDLISDPQLNILGTSRLLLQDDRVVLGA
jgi:hypothetical protein